MKDYGIFKELCNRNAYSSLARTLSSAKSTYMTQKTLKRINLLIQDIMRSPFDGLGKPEPLRENLSGWWSRRIDDTNRIVYKVEPDTIVVAQCKTHYGN